MKKSAFTLAETLVSLVIIGVIASITIPVIIQKTEKQEFISSLKKVYSVLSQTAQIIISEEGSPKGEEGWADSAEHVYTLFKQHLNYIKECTKDGEVCFAKGDYKYLNGNRWRNINDEYKNSLAPKLILIDGAAFGVYQNPSLDCTLGNEDDGTERDICAWLLVDVNGAKAPNKSGRDLFWFVLKENGLYPRSCSRECNYSNGNECTCSVIKKGRMDY